MDPVHSVLTVGIACWSELLENIALTMFKSLRFKKNSLSTLKWLQVIWCISPELQFRLTESGLWTVQAKVTSLIALRSTSCAITVAKLEDSTVCFVAASVVLLTLVWIPFMNYQWILDAARFTNLSTFQQIYSMATYFLHFTEILTTLWEGQSSDTISYLWHNKIKCILLPFLYFPSVIQFSE